MARVELTPEENLLLLREIEANRAFILLAYQSDPALLKRADPQIRRLFENVHEVTRETDAVEPKWGTAEAKRLEIERLRREIEERKKR